MRSRGNKSKRYGVLIALLLINWLSVFCMIFKVDPERVRDFVFADTYFPILFLIFSGFFLLLSIIFLSAKVAFRWSLGIVFYIYLKITGVGNLLNGLLILGILIVLEYYFSIDLIEEKFKTLKNATITDKNKQND